VNETVDRLVEEGLLERVPADQATARRWLDDARRHLVAAQRISDDDPIGAFVLSYDAARKSIAAVLLAAGIRAMAAPGSHWAIAQAAESLATTASDRSRLRRLETMRRTRNRTEYGSIIIGAQEVESALAGSRWINEFARRQVRGRRPRSPT
jgi:hypothetical protein